MFLPIFLTDKSPKRLKQSVMSCAPNYSDRIVCSQAHWFIYSSAVPSLSIFRDEYFKTMLLSMIPPQEKPPKYPVMTIPKLKIMIEGEYDCFCKMLRNTIGSKFKEGKGNPFLQFINDGCTLGNKSKYQAFGLQFTDSSFQCNHVIAIAFKRALSSTSDSVALMAREVVNELTGFDFNDVCGASVQDAAAKGVARALNLEEETCDMHDGDKIGRAAIGELLRRNGSGGIVNPFDQGMLIVVYLFSLIFYSNIYNYLLGKALMDKLRDQAKHFHSTHKNRVNYDEFLKMHPELPSNSILRDLNETRISSRHNLIRSSLRLKQSLTMYFGAYQLRQFLEEGDWEFAREAEAVLNVSKDVCTIAQNETLLNSAFGPVMKKVLHKKLKASEIEMIDLPNWGKSSRAPRVLVSVNSWSRNGLKCRKRATLECERRFFGNTSEQLIAANDPRLRLSNREKAVLVLDKRTSMNGKILKKAEWRDAVNALEDFYVQFYAKAKAFERKGNRLPCAVEVSC